MAEIPDDRFDDLRADHLGEEVKRIADLQRRLHKAQEERRRTLDQFQMACVYARWQERERDAAIERGVLLWQAIKSGNEFLADVTAELEGRIESAVVRAENWERIADRLADEKIKGTKSAEAAEALVDRLLRRLEGESKSWHNFRHTEKWRRTESPIWEDCVEEKCAGDRAFLKELAEAQARQVPWQRGAAGRRVRQKEENKNEAH